MFSFHSKANESPKTYLAIGETLGWCNTIGMMMKFQKAHQIEGGDEFLDAWFTAELDRLGVSTNDFFSTCAKARRSSSELRQDK